MSLMKLQRLVNGDDLFKMRVEAACWMADVPFTDAILRHAAADVAVQDDTELDEHQTINSKGVPDSAIISALSTYTTNE